MKEFYSIGEIAADLDVSIDKLRRWEKMFPKILKPIRRNNWRYYRRVDVHILRNIKYLLACLYTRIGNR
jgi:DNA-binding transcriptional MerR regulator